MRNWEGDEVRKTYTFLIIKAEDAQRCASSVFLYAGRWGVAFWMNIRENVLFNVINRYLCRTIKKNNIIIINLKNK